MTTKEGLDVGEIDVWLIDLDARRDIELESALSLDEKEYGARIRVPEIRRRWVSSRAALRRILESYNNSKPIVLERTCRSCGAHDHGKPELKGHSDFRFSMSRAGGEAVVAITRNVSIGIDIVDKAGNVDWVEVGNLAFTAQERDELDAAQPTWPTRRARQLWARKEAVAKALGLGLALDLAHRQLGAGEFDSRWRAGGDNVLFADVNVCSSVCCALAVVSEATPQSLRLLRF